jgi:hypothetical protein
MDEKEIERMSDLIVADAFGPDPLTPSQRHEAISNVLRSHNCGASVLMEVARVAERKWIYTFCASWMTKEAACLAEKEQSEEMLRVARVFSEWAKVAEAEQSAIFDRAGAKK